MKIVIINSTHHRMAYTNGLLVTGTHSVVGSDANAISKVDVNTKYLLHPNSFNKRIEKITSGDFSIATLELSRRVI